MTKLWTKSTYELSAATGRSIKIDVTSSVSPGLPPHNVLAKEVVPFFRDRKVRRILDFGAGALRHARVLLDAGFQVCAVEFEECYSRRACRRNKKGAETHSGFDSLVWPKAFCKDSRKWDAVLLCYVLQVMPIARERDRVLSELARKVKSGGFLLYMSRFGQIGDEDKKHRVGDGYYKWPDRDVHSFYREFPTDDTHEWMKKYGFERMASLSERGTEQVILYHRPEPYYA